MADTLTLLPGIIKEPQAVYQLKRSAVDQFKTVHHLTLDEEVWTAIGLSKATFYRLLRGAHDICACRAQGIAARLGRTVPDAFDQVARHG